MKITFYELIQKQWSRQDNRNQFIIQVTGMLTDEPAESLRF